MADTVRPRGRRSLTAFAFGCLLTAGLVVTLYFGANGWFRTPGPAPATSPVWDRPEFTRLVMGKPEAEVLAAVGPPDSTTQDDRTKYWHYKWRTRDPLTEATDSDVQVVVDDGVVVAVNY